MRFAAFIRAMRPHQWVKNLLLLVPLVTAHKIADAHSWLAAAQAVAAMCLAAAAIYLGNDIRDLDADRAHRSKARRPFASRQLPVRAGLVAIPVLLAAAVLVALPLPREFLIWMDSYIVAAFAYSLWLKRFAIVDVLVLAMLYTVRLIAGAAAIAVPMSSWLLAFSMFFFLSLALLKRFEEIKSSHSGGDPGPVRGYRQSDVGIVATLGIVSGALSVLVMALYTDGRDIAVLYSHPAWLWGFSPLLLYWISRMWLHASRGEMHDDPIVFAATDWASYAVLAGLGACMYLAS